MKKSNRIIFSIFIIFCIFFSNQIAAEQRYVTDRFEIMLRSGPSGKHAIQRMLKSGTSLELLEQDVENGYSLVRTHGGTEGWVLSRYLMREPAARVQLEQLVKHVTSTEPQQNSSIHSQTNMIKAEYKNINKRVADLEQEKKQLEQQLDDIKSTAANVLAIDAENKQLHQKFVETKSQLETLQAEYSALSSSNEKDWFVTGALVLLGGLLLGMIIPKINWGRRSRYGGF
ncbi:MAG: TIGR04211 family SH3 domain-containing protein [Burkholderiales bacterium]|uniref:TIGR04211 family SH3 domain-containing protein n=1 Tax=Nitrosomonas sp. TaxID=42353 RepID=UPI001D488D5A|nr:TIGR04211 family SH3 domain-containing protein [Nitrosomonas sp.]MCB1948581.1 TIGR04211 family SH3 domain-containing protein [Nitrosomonas sp.]MCP5243065.1 TIGR04211 family SH3 domain-containing protein [Burkholderiales bacterium]